MIEANGKESEKVVVQLGSKVIKGYVESKSGETIEELLSNACWNSKETLRVRSCNSDAVEEISLAETKAIFYVNSFEGDSEHTELSFHSRAPLVHGIWVRVQFLDGEVIEGIVYNSLRYLIDPGFFLMPTDPESNNKLVYVVKSSLADHRILGLRNL